MRYGESSFFLFDIRSVFETYKHHNQPNVISRNLSLLGNDGYLGLVAASNRFDRFLELRQVRVLDLLLLFPGILHCRSPGGGLSIREDLTISEQCPEGGKRDGEGGGGDKHRIASPSAFASSSGTSPAAAGGLIRDGSRWFVRGVHRWMHALID